jgi:hypothetical protein
VVEVGAQVPQGAVQLGELLLNLGVWRRLGVLQDKALALQGLQAGAGCALVLGGLVHLYLPRREWRLETD